MFCPLGHPLPAAGSSAQFCPTCGSALINPCPVGHDNAPNAHACRECGRTMVRPSSPPSEATAVVHRTTIGASSAPRSVGARPLGQAPQPPPADDTDTRPGEQHGRALLIAIVAIAAALVSVVIALVATSLGGSTPAADSPATPSAANPRSTTAPPPRSTSTTLSAQARSQGQALTALLSQSAGSRSQVQAATAAVTSCGDLTGAHSALSAAQASRQALLSQLGQLDLSALPQSTALIKSLTDAWQSSASSDGSYAQWAVDEQSKGCVPEDTGDASYQAALSADGRASKAKQQFTSLWDPIATSLGLQRWQPSQL